MSLAHPLATVEQVPGLYRDRDLDLNIRHFTPSPQHEIKTSP
jgi:hypothetical protein